LPSNEYGSSKKIDDKLVKNGKRSDSMSKIDKDNHEKENSQEKDQLPKRQEFNKEARHKEGRHSTRGGGNSSFQSQERGR
jgi:hypothetical protein